MNSEANRLLAKAVQEYTDSAMAGEIISPQDFIRRYPEIAADLQTPIASLYRLARAKSARPAGVKSPWRQWAVAAIAILLVLALSNWISRRAVAITVSPALQVIEYPIPPQGRAEVTSAGHHRFRSGRC